MAVNLRQPRHEIAPMRPTDLDQVMEIERLSFRSPWSRQVFLEELDREWARLDVLRPRGGGLCLAFVNYWVVRDEIHVLNIATHPSERRRGLGTQVLGHVIEVARESRCRQISLEVRRSNVAAIRLYRRFGFRPVGIRPNYYAEDHEDALVMALDL